MRSFVNPPPSSKFLLPYKTPTDTFVPFLFDPVIAPCFFRLSCYSVIFYYAVHFRVHDFPSFLSYNLLNKALLSRSFFFESSVYHHTFYWSPATPYVVVSRFGTPSNLSQSLPVPFLIPIHGYHCLSDQRLFHPRPPRASSPRSYCSL